VNTSYARAAIPAPRYVVNLDLAPKDRWTHVVADYKADLQFLLKQMKAMVPPAALRLTSMIGDNVEKYLPHPYSLEIVGVSLAGGLTVGDMVLANIIYELTAYSPSGLIGRKACTSIVAEALNGTMYHGRNLDYSFAAILRNMTAIVDFQSGGKTVYTGTTFVGYVGLLTGQRPHAYTITLNQRNEGYWWMNALVAIIAGGRGVAAFLIRDTLADTSLSFDDAVQKLAYDPLVAPCYLIVGGVMSTEGVVITRNRIAALNIWWLNTSQSHWFLVETNYDHWEQPPKYDDRRGPAIKEMNEIGRDNISTASLYHVLSTPPVLNDGTTYTVTMSASIPELYSVWIRYYP
jgi:N-acylethanolamine-hydrolysing acid amidase